MPGAKRVAVLDRGKDCLVPRQAQALDIRAAVGDVDRFTQWQRQHVAHVREQIVAGRLGNGAVEVQVGLQQRFVGLRGFHAKVGFFDGGNVFVGGRGRGPGPPLR
jgi:hypothetical protein